MTATISNVEVQRQVAELLRVAHALELHREVVQNIPDLLDRLWVTVEQLRADKISLQREVEYLGRKNERLKTCRVEVEAEGTAPEVEVPPVASSLAHDAVRETKKGTQTAAGRTTQPPRAEGGRLSVRGAAAGVPAKSREASDDGSFSSPGDSCEDAASAAVPDAKQNPRGSFSSRLDFRDAAPVPARPTVVGRWTDDKVKAPIRPSVMPADSKAPAPSQEEAEVGSTQGITAAPAPSPVIQEASLRLPDELDELFKAVEGGRFEEVQTLLSLRVDPETTNCKGETPLTRAAQLDQWDVMGILLSHGARPNRRDFTARGPAEALLIMFSADRTPTMEGRLALKALSFSVRKQVVEALRLRRQAQLNEAPPVAGCAARVKEELAAEPKKPVAAAPAQQRGVAELAEAKAAKQVAVVQRHVAEFLDEPKEEGSRGPWMVGGLEFAADFDSGNCGGVEPSKQYFIVQVSPDPQEAESEAPGARQWFHFRVRGASKGQRLRFQVRLGGPNSTARTLIQEMRPVVASAPLGSMPHLKDWHLVCPPLEVLMMEDSSCLTFQHAVAACEEGRDLYFATTFPYPWCEVHRHLDSFCKALETQGAYVHRERLVRSLGGRWVELLTFTGPGGRRKGYRQLARSLGDQESRVELFADRQAIFISARVHPGESPASYSLEGFLDFLAEGTSIAQELMSRFVFIVVPVLNPDGVFLGHHRTDTRGNDLNRKYSDSAPEAEFPTICAAMEACRCAHRQQNEVQVYLDFHSHSSRLGGFLLANAEGSDRVQAQLFGYALARCCPTVEYTQCTWEEVASAGRTWAKEHTGAPFCFTVETHYVRGNHRASPYGPEDFRRLGKSAAEATWACLCLASSQVAEPAPHGLAELPAARRCLEDAAGLLDECQGFMKKLEPPSRTRPQFFKVLSGPLHGRCVEVVECLEPKPGFSSRTYVLHEDDGGLELEEQLLEQTDAQDVNFKYEAQQVVEVSERRSPSSKKKTFLQRNEVVVVEERVVVEGWLRLRLRTGGWASEHCTQLFDGRLVGQVNLRRLEPVEAHGAEVDVKLREGCSPVATSGRAEGQNSFREKDSRAVLTDV